MTFKEQLLKYLHQFYRKSEFLHNFFEAVQTVLNTLNKNITRLEFLLHFNKLDEAGCSWWENLLNITEIDSELEDRRSKIRAKFISRTHNDLELIQKICDSWKNGEVLVDFVSGKITIQFVGEFGVPNDLDGLLKAVGDVKPAHLAYVLIFKYLLIKNIHEVKTITEMEQITLNQFAFGSEGV